MISFPWDVWQTGSECVISFSFSECTSIHFHGNKSWDRHGLSTPPLPILVSVHEKTAFKRRSSDTCNPGHFLCHSGRLVRVIGRGHCRGEKTMDSCSLDPQQTRSPSSAMRSHTIDSRRAPRALRLDLKRVVIPYIHTLLQETISPSLSVHYIYISTLKYLTLSREKSYQFALKIQPADDSNILRHRP